MEEEAGLSATQIEELNIRPTLKIFESKDIINWRTISIGAEVIYSLIVLREDEIYDDDGFEFKKRDSYRVLKLNEEGNYQIDYYSGNSPMWTITKSAFPKDVSGAPLKRIPFEFCGSDNNDAVPDVPVLYDILSDFYNIT